MFKLLFFYLLLVLVYCNDPGVDVTEEEDDVLVLDEDNFKDALQANPLLMVEFYAPWCKHCQKLAPEYVAAAKTLKANGVPVKLAKVDAIKNKALARKEGLKGYPLIKWYRGTVDIDFYKYGREKETLVEWVTRKSAPSTVDLETVEAAKAFIDRNRVTVIGFFKDKDCDAEKIFERVGYSVEDVNLGVTNSEAVFKYFSVAIDSVVILFKKLEESEDRFNGKIDFKSVKDFINSNSVPYLMEYTEEEWKTIFHGKLNKHFFLWFDKKREQTKATVAALTSVAKDFIDDMMFVLIAVDEVDHERLSTFFSIEDSEIPTFRISSTKPDIIHKYKPTNNELTEENFRNFVTQFQAGKLKPDLKSQDVPSDWDKRELKELVGSNFGQVALNKARYVFVYFYSPTCGAPCDELEPVIKELAEKMKKRHNIIIARMNGAENEIELFKIRSYPTLKLFKSGDNEVVEFKGKKKTLEAFEEFLEEFCRVNVRRSNSLRDKSGKHIMPPKEKSKKKEKAKKKAARDEL